MNIAVSSTISVLLLCCMAIVSSSSSDPNPFTPFIRNQIHEQPDSSLDFESFGFSLNDVDTNYMWLDTVHVGTQFSNNPDSCLQPLRPLTLHPSSTVLNYGQALFEGMKAFRRKDGKIIVFRPEDNAKRLANGARRLLLPEVPASTFLEAVDSIVRSNSKFVPPAGKGALYLRPLLFGSEKSLGVKPAKEVTFCIYASPVGNYFKGELKCITLQAVRGYSRASRGGSGHVKASGNYAPSFFVQRQVRERGFDEALFLDSVSGEYIEEAGASNFFAVFAKTKTIVTPPLDSNTILPGITRSSIIELARSELGWNVEERNIHISELKGADEAFCCGTGASVTPVGVVNYFSGQFSGESDENDATIDDFEITFGDGITPGKVTETLYRTLLGLQNGDLEDRDILAKYSDWIHEVKP